MLRSGFQSTVLVALALAISLSGQGALADARTEYLLGMLADKGNYRVRVQAATTLGQLRSKEAIPALCEALSDSHELVVITAVLVTVLIVIFQNTDPVETKLLFLQITMPRAALLATTLLIGFAIGVLFAGRLARRKK